MKIDLFESQVVLAHPFFLVSLSLCGQCECLPRDKGVGVIGPDFGLPSETDNPVYRFRFRVTEIDRTEPITVGRLADCLLNRRTHFSSHNKEYLCSK